MATIAKGPNRFVFCKQCDQLLYYEVGAVNGGLATTSAPVVAKNQKTNKRGAKAKAAGRGKVKGTSKAGKGKGNKKKENATPSSTSSASLSLESSLPSLTSASSSLPVSESDGSTQKCLIYYCRNCGHQETIQNLAEHSIY